MTRTHPLGCTLLDFSTSPSPDTQRSQKSIDLLSLTMIQINTPQDEHTMIPSFTCCGNDGSYPSYSRDPALGDVELHMFME
jgi:hypothetical protein